MIGKSLGKNFEINMFAEIRCTFCKDEFEISQIQDEEGIIYFEISAENHICYFKRKEYPINKAYCYILSILKGNTEFVGDLYDLKTNICENFGLTLIKAELLIKNAFRDFNVDKI